MVNGRCMMPMHDADTVLDEEDDPFIYMCAI